MLNLVLVLKNSERIECLTFPILNNYLAITKTEDYNLPSDYVLAINPGGNLFYKIYQKMNYTAAESQCESDGTLLAVPRSEKENDIIASLSTEELWIGVNDLDEEGTFITVEGNLSYTNWFNAQPSNWVFSNGYDEDGVVINWRQHGYWNDAPIFRLRAFVCLYRIKSTGTSKITI